MKNNWQGSEQAWRMSEIPDLENLAYFIWMEIVNTKQIVFMHQKKYAEDILKRFKMSSCNLAITPMETKTKLRKESDNELVDNTLYKQIIDSLRYLCNIMSNIFHSVELVSRFTKKLMICHLLAANKILRYIRGTPDHGVLMPNQQNTRICAKVCSYFDSNWADDQNDRKSIIGNSFMLGSTPISWSLKKWKIVAPSSCETEYVATLYVACQTLWLEMMLEELGVSNFEKIKLLVDNQSAIDLENYPMSYGRSKHIERRYHFLKDQVS